MKNRWNDWLKQAKNDLLWAKDSLSAGRYSQVCFIAQQVAEKAIKAYAFYKGIDQIRSHSVLEIARALEINGELEKIAMRLDQYYISARYPDAFLSGAPYEYFTQEQAEEAKEMAENMVRIIEGMTAENE